MHSVILRGMIDWYRVMNIGEVQAPVRVCVSRRRVARPHPTPQVQLRTSVRVYREMPSLRNTLYDVVVTTELVDDLIARVFGALPAEAEGASLHLQPPEGEGAAGGDSDGFTAREEVTAAAAAAAAAAAVAAAAMATDGNGIVWPEVSRVTPPFASVCLLFATR